MTTAPLFAGMGGHQTPRESTTDEWLTPLPVLNAVGGWRSFDLDPCAPEKQPFPTACATYTARDNGLLRMWHGRVWMNPPYHRDVIGHWLARLAEHGRGLALIFARTDTEAFDLHVWRRATALLFLRGRLTFLDVTGKPKLNKHGREQNGGAPSVLCAYGSDDADVLAGCGLDGAFVPLRLARGVVICGLSQTWLDVIAEHLARDRGPVALADLYRELARHPKAARNPNYRAKIRQVLQRGPFRRVARGEWCAA